MTPPDSMDEILPRLWLGDIAGPQDAKTLEKRNIRAILSVLEFEIDIPEGIAHKHVQLIDTGEADLLGNVVPCIEFIQTELDKGHSVLVHCFAGVSRSASMVTAYIMYSQNLSSADAMRQLQKARPIVSPNRSFVAQLDIFHQAITKVNTESSTEEDKLKRLAVAVMAVMPTKEELNACVEKYWMQELSSSSETTQVQRTTVGGSQKGPEEGRDLVNTHPRRRFQRFASLFGFPLKSSSPGRE
ncbi:hypothetical protein FRC17_000974 [Serendipita sp. 399]|nr:hypothetical protein FRC17_000974 [Serendipita sp. 399]